MTITHSETQMGQLLATYQASKRKMNATIMLGVVVALVGLFFTGSFWAVNPLVGVGFLVCSLVALYFVVRSFLNTRGRSAEVFEQGIRIQVRGRTQAWRFKDIAAVTVRGSQADPRKPFYFKVNSFAFHVDDGQFSIRDHYESWTQLGSTVIEGMVKARMPETISRLEQGQDVVFDGLVGKSGVKKLTLKLTAEGIVENERRLIPWGEARGCGVGQHTNVTASVWGKDGEPLITFALYNARNAWLAMRTIELLAQGS